MKHYTKHNLPDVRGPITIVSGSFYSIEVLHFFLNKWSVFGYFIWEFAFFSMSMQQCFSGKQRRLQFVECPNDINGMIDAAKFADLTLLLIDGSYGFEMVRYHHYTYFHLVNFSTWNLNAFVMLILLLRDRHFLTD